MNENANAQKNILWLTAPIAILLVIAAGGGVLINGLYHDSPDMVAQAKGQDLVSLIVVLPILIITAILARRGSLQSLSIWLGGLVYLIYTYASYAFAIRYNSLFLVYIALLGCSLYTLIGSLTKLDMAGVKACFSEKTPAKAVSVYLAALGILFYFLWLSELVPALIARKIPQSVLDAGTPTNVVYVLDMAWILPSFWITAVSLWRKRSWGYTIAGIMLPFFVFLVSATLSMGLLQAREGNPGAFPMVVIFSTLLVTGLGMLSWYFKGLRLTPVTGNEQAVL